MTARVFPWLYDLVMAAAERRWLAPMRARLVAGLGGRVLEVGAGTGLDFPHYPAAALVVATEPDVAMLERARARARQAPARVLVVAADAEALPFRDGAFDAGVVALALCTIPRPQRALEELRRVLRPGVPLRLLEHVRAPDRRAARMQERLTPVWRRLAGGCHLDRDTVAEVARAGFTVERLREHAGGVVVEVAASAPLAQHRGTGERTRET
ncbi:MAG TPA: methyltransferase domain-containing protein [Gemmatimonadaceae bacterium]|nr:methyltransferase domain-containing protein [Gemmatimonadaceae bacterium]